MANSKVTKHPKFLPMKHGNKNRELKAAERTRTSCSHPLHPFTDGPMLPATSRHAHWMLVCRCLHLITRHHRAKRTHAPKKAQYRLMGNLKGAVKEITGLTPTSELPTYITTGLRNTTSPCHTDSMKSGTGCEIQASPGMFNMATAVFCQSILKTENKTN